jgi:hypothetical protein
MPTQIDICNAALSEVGTRSTIASMTEASNEARNCAIHWDFARRSALRAAHWSFAGTQVALALLSAQMGTPENPNGVAPMPPWPWNYEYAYPNDCLRIRYLQWPPTTNGTPTQLNWTGNYPPLDTGDSGALGANSMRRRPPYEVSSDMDTVGNKIKVILTNLEFALIKYTYDCTDPNMWDADFEEAFIWIFAAKLCGPLTGDKEQAKLCAENALEAILKAKVDDANESPQSPNTMPDWIRARGLLGMESLEFPDLDVSGLNLVEG